jgi:hypothetical protein
MSKRREVRVAIIIISISFSLFSPREKGRQQLATTGRKHIHKVQDRSSARPALEALAAAQRLKPYAAGARVG